MPKKSSLKPRRPSNDPAKQVAAEMLRPPNALFAACNGWENLLGEAELGQQSRSETRSNSREETDRRSARPYATRVADPGDFASVWENRVVPWLRTRLLDFYGDSDFSVDVHIHGEATGTCVPRHIYISGPKDLSPAEEDVIRHEIASLVGEFFQPLTVEFVVGHIARCMDDSQAASRHQDSTCPPKNMTFREELVIGVSIGPKLDVYAGSLGGFFVIGGLLYAMTALHIFTSCVQRGHMDVTHPAAPDYLENRRQDRSTRRCDIGKLAFFSTLKRTRPSMTFDGLRLPSEETQVEMDWAAIQLSVPGRNVVAVPSFGTGAPVTVQHADFPRGNTEVYALARTSGYSLGLVSDVPGLQRFNGAWHREWTVRQYTAGGGAPEESLTSQSLKSWITSGIGVLGDSGAWLMRRSDNAVIGLVWARNHTSGPSERTRLAYFTPIVDIFADICEQRQEAVTLPRCAPQGVAGPAGKAAAESGPEEQRTPEPWNVWSTSSLERLRRDNMDLLRLDFVGGAATERSALRSHHPVGAPGRDYSVPPEALGRPGTATMRSQRVELPSVAALSSSQPSTPSMVSGGTASTTLEELASEPSQAHEADVRLFPDDGREADLDHDDDAAPVRAKATPLMTEELLQLLRSCAPSAGSAIAL